MFAQRCRPTSAKHDYIASAVRGNMLASAVCARSCCGLLWTYFGGLLLLSFLFVSYNMYKMVLRY